MNRKRELYDLVAVGMRIAARREELGLSQEALAEKMDRATKYVSDIERGKCGMSISTLIKYSECLNIGLDYMIYGIDKSDFMVESPSAKALIESIHECPESKRHYLTQIIRSYNDALKKSN